MRGNIRTIKVIPGKYAIVAMQGVASHVQREIMMGKKGEAFRYLNKRINRILGKHAVYTDKINPMVISGSVWEIIQIRELCRFHYDKPMLDLIDPEDLKTHKGREAWAKKVSFRTLIE